MIAASTPWGFGPTPYRSPIDEIADCRDHFVVAMPLWFPLADRFVLLHVADRTNPGNASQAAIVIAH
jgi:hypothetical protein